MKRLLKYTVILLALLTIAVAAVDIYVTRSVEEQLYDDVQTIGHHKVGLLLGTSKYVAGGRVNLYYKYRIEAAARLYKAGKIDFILVSGDNRKLNYNEPETMKKDLIAAGIPENRVFLDYAGFRTLDSIVRSRAVFDADDIVVISQRFHNERALFIANSKGIKAKAFNAQDPPQRLQVKVLLREKLARVKMLLDLLFNKQPKFYGDKIVIEDTLSEQYVMENTLFTSGPTSDSLFCNENLIIPTDCGIGKLYITTNGDALYNIFCVGDDSTKYYLGRYSMTDSNLVCTFHQTYTFYSGCGECPPEIADTPHFNTGALAETSLKYTLRRTSCQKYPYAMPVSAEELQKQHEEPKGDVIYTADVFGPTPDSTAFMADIRRITRFAKFHSSSYSKP